ncbi:hypothetical protein GBAR_LOCUS10329, partial [Geodia barretti]
GLGEGGDEGVAGFSGCGSLPVTPRSPLVPGRRDRLPSLQSRKRSLPSFARGSQALSPKLPRLQTNTVEPALPVSPPVVDSQLTASDSRQPALIDHSLSLTTTLSDSLPEISLRSPDLV